MLQDGAPAYTAFAPCTAMCGAFVFVPPICVSKKGDASLTTPFGHLFVDAETSRGKIKENQHSGKEEVGLQPFTARPYRAAWCAPCVYLRVGQASHPPHFSHFFFPPLFPA